MVRPGRSMSLRMETELWMHVLVIMGIVSIIRGGLLAGIVLVVIGLLVGPRRPQHLLNLRARPLLRAGGPGPRL